MLQEHLLLTKFIQNMSWFQEWFSYIEMVDGQSGIQCIDYARSYKIHQNLVACVWKQAIACHQSQGKVAHVLEYMSQMHNYRKERLG